MRTLHRYLLREMIATVGVAVVVCTGLLLLGNMLKEVLTLLMAGQASLALVARGVGLLIPFVLAFALPMGVLTAALLVFGRFSADQELTAARANGVSLIALALPVILFGLALCGLCAWVNLDLAPRCRVAYKQLFAELLKQRARALIPAGRFVTHFPGFVIFADRVQPSGTNGVLDLEDVLFFQINEGRKVLDVRAPRARLEPLPEERALRLTFLDGRALQWLASAETLPVSDAKGQIREDPAPETPEDGEEGPGADESESDRATPEELTGDGATSGMAARGESVGDAGGQLPGETQSGETLSGAATGEGGRSPEAAGMTAIPAPAGFWQPVTMGELPIRVSLPPEVMSGGLPELSDMTWSQLRSERRELRRLGIEELTTLDLQIHKQVAFSFACFGFVLVGIPLGVRGHRRETSVGVAVAIGLVLVYYSFLIVAQALDNRPEAAPWLIVWMPNALFQLAGGWLLWRADRG